MALFWLAVKSRTGEVITDLRDLSCSRVSSVLGSYTTTAAALPIPTAPKDWERATEPKASWLLLVDDVDSKIEPTPVWGGRITSRTRSLGDVMSLTLSTLEAMLDEFYVGDVTYTGVDQCELAADLVEQFVLDGTHCLEVEYEPSAITRDREYTDDADKTVWSALSELAGVIGGPEFTVSWKWLHDPERLIPVLMIRDRVGSAPIEGLDPAATFETGNLTDATYTEDYSAGKFANDVIASSSGVGAARPESPRQVSADADRPTSQYRFTPSTSITNVDTLTDHARKVLAAMRTGSRSLSLTAINAGSVRLGKHWRLGDDVGYRIGGVGSAPDTEYVPDAYPDTYTDAYRSVALVKKYPNGRDTVPAFPGGLTGTARAIGWELDLTEPQTVTPILELGGAA